MQVTIGANCWNGERRKTLTELFQVEMPIIVKPTHAFKSKLKLAAKRMNDPKVRAVIGFTIPIVLLAHGIPSFGIGAAVARPDAVAAFAPDAVMAGGVIGDSVKGVVLHAFDPVITLITTLAYPIAGVMIAAGCLFLMVGSKEKGMSMLQNAAIGYILVQLSPLFLKLLVGIGDSM